MEGCVPQRPQILSWPLALRAVRGWLEPWMSLLTRWWRAWCDMPPPPTMQQLLDDYGTDIRLTPMPADNELPLVRWRA